MRELERTVFPSTEKTILMEDESKHDAHYFQIRNSVGMKDGKPVYDETYQSLQFAKKEDSGEMVPGVQDEQLIIIMLERTKVLNERFPSDFNKKKIEGLETALEACKERVQDRMDRGVMGDLKK